MGAKTKESIWVTLRGKTAMNTIREFCEQQANADTSDLPGSDDYHRGRRAAFREVVRQIDIEQMERACDREERHRRVPIYKPCPAQQ